MNHLAAFFYCSKIFLFFCVIFYGKEKNNHLILK